MPMLDDLMPWGVRPLRTGRSWVLAPDPETLRARWDRLVTTRGTERDALFGCTRGRTPRTAVGQLPGQRTATGRFAQEDGRCPEPVRILHGPFDQQWLIPDHRLIDSARPELWRVADERQVFVLEQPGPQQNRGPAVLVSGLLPDGHAPTGRPGRIRPFYRRPGGVEPNLAPGLLGALERQYGQEVAPEDALAWVTAASEHSPTGCAVPLPADPALWSLGIDIGRRLMEIQLRGVHGRQRPRLPGGRRPYVRTALPPWPDALAYDRAQETLEVGTGRISPVPVSAWEFRQGGVRVLDLWFDNRTSPVAPGTLDALRPTSWPQEWTSELLALITVLSLLSEVGADRDDFLRELAGGDLIEVPEVLPVPAEARRPASVLDHCEEGPEGQFALL
ncbi:type ISP restriction/modification enzyme [Streptomyces sp. NBC_00690]|uniref:type ISP restriction/modification enzyme n=1 Tax=Streptomyces sp. NBC_00690 TaxID=2975808 RepID=UPI002E2CC3B3|nr:type ISP restriction/modification enzyme [Streptomyces sp. NBC_00690]